MAGPYTPRDIAVGNNMLPLLQMIAQNQRRRAMAQQQGMSGQPMPAPAARAPTPNEPLSLVPEQMAPVRPPAGVISRQRTPMALPANAPASASQAAAPRPALAAQGLGEMLQGLSPDERNMMRSSMLAGMAGGLNDVLARRPNAGFGEMLLGAGAGGLQGQMFGQRGVREERRLGMADRLTNARLAETEAEAQRKQQEAQRIQALLADPNTPPEQKRILEMSLAGVPGGAIRAMIPTPGKPEIIGGERGGYYLVNPDGTTKQLRPGLGNAPTKPEIFGSGATGYYTLGPDNKPQQIVAAAPGGGSGAGTALTRNVPFVAKALNISEGEATKMLLTPAGGRKTPEQMRADFTKALLASPRVMGDPTRAVQGADQIMQMLEGGAAEAPPMVTEAPTEGWGDYIAGFMPDFMGGEEAPTATAAPPAEAPSSTSAAGDIESMGYDELEALDQYSLSAEDRERARLRWDQLNAGGS